MIEKVTLASDQYFDFDKANLKPAALGDLDRLAEHLKGVSVKTVHVVGYTDGIGTDAYNDKLSLRRADAVRDYLVSKGVDPKLIDTEGRGKRDPVADNKTKDGRAKNRRVEVKIEGQTSTMPQ